MQNHSETTRRLVYAWEGDMEALRAENERLRDGLRHAESILAKVTEPPFLRPTLAYTGPALAAIRDALKQPSTGGEK